MKVHVVSLFPHGIVSSFCVGKGGVKKGISQSHATSSASSAEERYLPPSITACSVASIKSVPRHTCTYLTVAEREHMRITGLGETIAINVIKICCAINYKHLIIFCFFFFFSDIWLPLLVSSSSVFPDSYFQREKFEGLNE